MQTGSYLRLYLGDLLCDDEWLVLDIALLQPINALADLQKGWPDRFRGCLLARYSVTTPLPNGRNTHPHSRGKWMQHDTMG